MRPPSLAPVVALVVHSAKAVPEWEACRGTSANNQNLSNAAVPLYVGHEFVARKHPMQWHQIHHVVGDLEAVANPAKQARIRWVANDPSHRVAPCKEVKPVGDLAPVSAIWQQRVKGAVAPAGVKTSTARSKVAHHQRGKPRRRINQILLHWRMEQRCLRYQELSQFVPSFTVKPNPSIEGTCSGLRPPHAHHVKR
jgi:hypothetical protein